MKAGLALFGRLQRPSVFDEDIIARVANNLAVRVRAWLVEIEGIDDGDVEGELFDAIIATAEIDGYRIAQKLENFFNYRPDAALVEILDVAEDLANQFRVRAVKRWVEQYRIKPLYRMGDKVQIMFGIRSEIANGIICAVRDDVAEYMVAVPAEGHYGHISTKPDYFRGGRPGILVPFEDVIRRLNDEEFEGEKNQG